MSGTSEKGSERARRAIPREQVQISRRGFMGMLLATSTAFAAGSLPLAATAAVGSGEQTDSVAPVAIARVEEVPAGQSRRFAFPPVATSAVLINLPGEGLQAYSEECTHLGCVVYWDAGEGKILCPCHKGLFDPATGAPLAGPPRRPLRRVALEVRDGVIYAVGRGNA